jgi:hypothetical protein
MDLLVQLDFRVAVELLPGFPLLSLLPLVSALLVVLVVLIFKDIPLVHPAQAEVLLAAPNLASMGSARSEAVQLISHRSLPAVN